MKALKTIENIVIYIHMVKYVTYILTILKKFVDESYYLKNM